MAKAADQSHPDRRWEAVGVLGVLLVAAAFRLIRLASQPPGLFQDEADSLVNGLTIISGHPAIYFDQQEPLYFYVVAACEAVLGPIPLAVRVASAISGMIAVAAGGAFVRQLFGRTVGLVAAFGLACSLWMVALSRVGFRAITQPAVECLGLALLWRATRTGRYRDYVAGGAFLGLSIYTYLGSRLLPFAIVPFLALSAIFYRHWLIRVLPGMVAAGLAAVVVYLPLGYYTLHRPDILFGRPNQVALPTGSAYVPALIQSSLRTLGEIAVYGDPTWRHNFGGAPVFDPVNALVFFFGLILALRSRQPAAIFAVIMAFAMMVPGMLSIDSPHYLRTDGAAVPLYGLWALGIAGLSGLLNRAMVRPTRPSPGGEAERPPGGTTSLRPLLTVRPGLISAILLLAVAFGRGAIDYFLIYPERPEVAEAFNTRLATAGQFLAASSEWRDGQDQIFVTNRFEDDRASIAAFLAPLLPPSAQANWMNESTIGTFFPQKDILPLPTRPALYILAGDERDDRPDLAALTTSVVDLGGPVHDRIVVTRAAPPTTREAIAQFGNTLDLVGATIGPADATGHAKVTLRWHVLGKPSYAPSIFLHLEDSAHHGLGGGDVEVVASNTLWQPGQEFLSFHDVAVPAGTLPGHYLLTTGVYDKPTGRRETVTVKGVVVPVAAVGDLDLAAPVGGSAIVARASRLDVAPGLVYLGTDALPRSAEAGAAFPVTLGWEAIADLPPHAEVELTLRGPNGAAVGTWQGPIGSADFPTERWSNGVQIRQIVDLAALPTAPAGPATLDLTVHRADGSASSPISLGSLALSAPTHDYNPPKPANPLDARFIGVGTLVGFDLPAKTYAPGADLPIALYWHSDTAAPVGYTLFVHVLDDQDHVIAQRDEPPVHGTRPTTGWVTGEYIADPHVLTLPTNAPSGTWRVEIGMYDPATGKRVRLADGTDRVIIGRVKVGK